jgi:hypothetical protein
MALLGLGLAFPLVAQIPTPMPAPPRIWTTTEGRTFQATLVGVQGTQVTVRLANGQLAAIGLPRLSPADQAYVKGLAAPSGGGTPGPTAAAEYAALLPENAGVIHADEHERGLKEYLKHWQSRGIEPGAAGPVYELMQLPNETWAKRMAADDKNRLRLHFNSGLLVYYFCHLDGDGKGTRFLRYMDKIADARDAKLPPGARSSFGASQMDVLLDGRGSEDMQKAVVDGFKKIGVQW